MKFHLNRMTAALLAVLLLSVPALVTGAAPATDRPAATGVQPAGHSGFDLTAVWDRLLDGLSAIFAGDETGGDSDDDGEGTGSFDPDGYTFVPIDDGNHSTGTGSFDPDG